MPDRPSDVKKKLDELYKKTEDIRHDLISVHHMLTNSGYFAPPTSQYEAPVQQWAPPAMQTKYVPPVVEKQNAPPVPPPEVKQVITPPPVMQQHTPPVQRPVFTNVPPPPRPPQEPKKGFFDRNPDMEKFIGERLITFIGIAILVIGIAFFVKYAIDREWINEVGRTAIGILCGGILIGVAHRLRKGYTAFSSVLAGGGIATLYFTITYAFQVYHLFSQPAALGILVVITLFTVLLSVAYDRKELAILAIIGGFASPLMVKTGEGNFVVLCTYMLILDIGMLALAYYKKWNVITVLSFAFTILFYAVSLQSDITRNNHLHDHQAFLFATLFYITFFAMNIINNVKQRRKFEAFEILSLITNTGLYYGAGYFLLHHMNATNMTGLFTLVVALFNCVFAFLLFKRQEVDRNLVYFLVGIVITFVSLAGPVQLEGNHITLFWAAEAVLLYWFYNRSKLTIVKYFSMMLNLVLVLSTIYNWMNVYMLHTGDVAAFINKGFVTTIGAVISLGLSSYLLTKSEEEYISGSWPAADYRKLLSTFGVIILFAGGFFELSRVLQNAHYTFHAMSVFWATYVVLFVGSLRYALPYIKMEFLGSTLRVMTVIMLFAVVLFPHWSVANIRDSWLLGAENAFGPFMLHYVYSGAILLLGFMLLRDVYRNTTSRDTRNLYLWLMSAVTIFILSAELDHTMVMANCLNPENPAWRINDVPAHIAHGLTLSHKVGFPIIWGISSFVMMMIGMRRKNRQVRIISLVLFAGVIVKLILLGIYGESQTGKILAFVLCGVILLLVSFMYQKLRKILMDDSQTHQPAEDEKAS